MLIGHARVSTDDRTLDLQRDALGAAGCEKPLEDKAPGAKADRPGLERALERLRAGDTLVVWRLDRLGRSLEDLILRAGELKGQGVGLRSHREAIDTTSSGGRLVLHLFGAPAEFERMKAGLAAARARGRKGGRRKLLDPRKRAHAVDLYTSKKHTATEVCDLTGISRATLYACIEEFSDGP